MNGKKSKLIRRKAEGKLIDWIRTMIPEGEDASRINRKNLHEFLPEQTHIFANNKFMLSVKSRTLEENILILNIFLDDNNLNKKNIPLVIKKKMTKLNKKSEIEFVNKLKEYITNINEKIEKVFLPKMSNNLNEGIIEEEQNIME